MSTRLEQLYGKNYKRNGPRKKGDPAPPKGSMGDIPLKPSPTDRGPARDAWAKLDEKLGKLPPLEAPNYDLQRASDSIRSLYPGRPAGDSYNLYPATDYVSLPAPEPTLEKGYLSQIMVGQGLSGKDVGKVYSAPLPISGEVTAGTSANWSPRNGMWLSNREDTQEWQPALVAHELQHAQVHKENPWFRVRQPQNLFDDYKQQRGHWPQGTPGNRGRADMLEAQNIMRQFGGLDPNDLGAYPQSVRDMYPHLQGQDPGRAINFRNPTGQSPWKSDPRLRGKNDE